MFKKIIISTILFFLFPHLAIAETVATDSTETIKQHIATFIAKYNIPAAVVQIYRDGKPQSIYLGNAKPATQFDVGSLKEIMTGLLLAQQVDAAKVQLTTPVKQFFPAGSDEFSKITLRSLATHTSGLPSNASIHYLTNANQANRMDETWQPSTIGMTLLTQALEAVAHKNIAELYQRQIFSALGMRSAKATLTELKFSALDMQKFLAAAIGLPGTPESVLYPMRLTQTAFIELNDRMIGLGWQINAHDEERIAEEKTAEEKTSAEKDAQGAENSIKEVSDRPVFKPDRQYDKVGTNAYIAVLPNKKTGMVILLSAQVNEKELAQLGRQLMAGLGS